MCRLIVARLVNGGPKAGTPQTESQDKQQAAIAQERSQALRELKDKFLRLAGDSNRNAAGLALEKLLNRLFALLDFNLGNPSGS